VRNIVYSAEVSEVPKFPISRKPLAKMVHKGTYPFILLALMSFTDATSLSCPPITISEIGSTAEFSTQGLVARGIVPLGVSAVPSIPVRIKNFSKVCDAAGDQINTSSFVSVVVEFQCDFVESTMNNPSLAVCSNSSNIVTRQYQFQCIEQNGQLVWDTIVSSSRMFVQTLNPTATLSTPLVDTCRRCIDDQQSSRADPTTHCDRESRSSSHWFFLLIIIIMCPQRVHHNVTRDNGIAILGRQLMYAATFIFEIIVEI
jgi:hypothetical protein